MAGLWFEEFEDGMVFNHEWSRTITETDNVWFSLLTMNVQPLHIDAHYAAKSEWGKPLVNSLFTLGLMIGMSVNDTTFNTTLANLGMKEVNFPKPLFHGDSVKTRTTVLSKRESKSRPNEGIVTFFHEMTNQNGEVVATCERAALMRKRPAADRLMRRCRSLRATRPGCGWPACCRAARICRPPSAPPPIVTTAVAAPRYFRWRTAFAGCAAPGPGAAHNGGVARRHSPCEPAHS